MKKLLFIGALGALSVLSSCRKDYTCVCTEDGYTRQLEYTHIKEDDAKDKCKEQQNTFNANGQKVVCKLD